jgi:hypothetical protein
VGVAQLSAWHHLSVQAASQRKGAAGTEAGHILFVALAREMSRWSAIGT